MYRLNPIYTYAEFTRKELYEGLTIYKTTIPKCRKISTRNCHKIEIYCGIRNYSNCLYSIKEILYTCTSLSKNLQVHGLEMLERT